MIKHEYSLYNVHANSLATPSMEVENCEQIVYIELRFVFF